MKTSIIYPPSYVKTQISPIIRGSDLTAEVVWTYLIARKYENNPQDLVLRLCGTDNQLPEDNKMWLESYLFPTRIRKDEQQYWKIRSDLAIGHLEEVTDRENQIQSSGGKWICIVESKWYDDIQSNDNGINQLLKIIDHALLLHDNKGHFPEKVYVTLVTPKYFKEGLGKFSHRDYSDVYKEYDKPGKLKLKEDLALCKFPFLKHDIDTLINRTNALILNWVTFEELLELSTLLEDHIPGKYRITIDSWKKVFSKMDMNDLYSKLSLEM